VGGDPRARKSRPRYIRLTAALALVLAQLRYDANGDPFPMWKYVFGDERGDKVTDVGKAWETCVLHAHGISPRWVNGALDPISRAALRENRPAFSRPAAFDKYEKMRALPPKVELVEFGRNVDKTCTRDAFQVLIEADKRNKKTANSS